MFLIYQRIKRGAKITLRGRNSKSLKISVINCKKNIKQICKRALFFGPSQARTLNFILKLLIRFKLKGKQIFIKFKFAN